MVNYADDSTLTISGNTWQEVEARANVFTDAIVCWLKTLDISINKTKSFYMRFGKNLKHKFNLVIEGEIVQPTKEFRYLGIRHTDKLDIGPQLEHISRKFCASTVLTHTLKDFGCKKQIKNVIMSYATGAFQHG